MSETGSAVNVWQEAGDVMGERYAASSLCTGPVALATELAELEVLTGGRRVSLAETVCPDDPSALSER